MKIEFLVVALSGFLALAVPVEKRVALTQGLSKRAGETYGESSNELSLCRTVQVIFARGTTEPGNLGTIVGPPFADALSSLLGSSNVGVTGVTYAADVAGYLEGGDPAGASDLAMLAEQSASSCPNSQIVLSGYSQGAQVVHLGAKELPSSVISKVKAIVLFGDPDDGQTFSDYSESNVDTYCATGDEICDGIPIISAAHLSYGVDASPAAKFVQARVTV